MKYFNRTLLILKLLQLKVFILPFHQLVTILFSEQFSIQFKRSVGVMAAHKPSKLDDVPPVRKRGFDSHTLLYLYARSVTAAQRLSVPFWGFQPLSSGSIPDGRANSRGL